MFLSNAVQFALTTMIILASSTPIAEAQSTPLVTLSGWPFTKPNKKECSCPKESHAPIRTFYERLSKDEMTTGKLIGNVLQAEAAAANMCSTGNPYCCSGEGEAMVCGPASSTSCNTMTICCINTNGVSVKSP